MNIELLWEGEGGPKGGSGKREGKISIDRSLDYDRFEIGERGYNMGCTVYGLCVTF